MNIVIRADASKNIGSGHIMRCLVLAEALLAKGHEVAFVSRKQQGDLIDYVRSKSIDVISLCKLLQPIVVKHSADYKAWLQVSWQEDAKEFIERVVDTDIVIVDHYAIDAKWECVVKNSLGCSVLAIDDLNREHQCELIIDQNLWPDMATRYRGCSGVKLLGPKYALLRKSFSILREQDTPCKNQVLAFFGGSDLSLECMKLAKAAFTVASLPFTLKIVAGRSNSAYQELLTMTEGTDIIVEQHIGDFDMELKQSKYVIGASGVSNWERFCLQVPASVVSVADNQKALARYLFDLGAIRYMGESYDTTVESYQKELEYLSSCWPDVQPLKSVFVDGLGVSRIIDKIEEVLAV